MSVTLTSQLLFGMLIINEMFRVLVDIHSLTCEEKKRLKLFKSTISRTPRLEFSERE